MERIKLVDLTPLREISKGNQEFEKMMLNTFIEELENDLEKIRKYTAEGDYPSLYVIAHKIKPSLHLIKIEGMLDVVLRLEEYARDMVKLEAIPALIIYLNKIAKEAIVEIKDDLNLLS